MLDFSTFVAACKQLGPFAAALLFFLWRDYRREGRMAARLDHLEDEQRDVIMPLVRETAEIISRNTAVLERLETILEHHRK